MPASTHPLFVHPDKEAAIWRYMDFTKYVSMLERGGLYFCRSDLLGDPFEGSVPQQTLEVEREFFAGGHMPGVSPEQAERIMRSQSDIRQRFRKIIYVNCWHMSPVESAAMWSLYARSAEAIAIQSTFSKLFDCLPENYYVGMVKYIDYKTDVIQSSNRFHPYLHKRRSYQHEHELRVMHPQAPSDGFERETPEGIWVPVNLAHLISTVYVSPNSRPWFRDLVKSVSNKYGLDRSVVQSDLDTTPVF